MIEKWRDIKGYENYYQVSNIGNVRSLDRTVPHPVMGFKKGKPCKQHPNHNGYMRVGLHKLGNREQEFVHKLVGQAFVSNPNSKPQINHIDGDKLNNNVENIEWCTNKENCIHASNLGLRNPVRGIEHHNAKMNPEKVKDLRKKRDEGWSYKQLCDLFGITKGVVGQIYHKRTWAYV